MSDSDSVLRNWDVRAAVRIKPRRNVTSRTELLGDPFPIELAPILSHRLLSDADSQLIRRALLQYLFSYLTFTDRLEHEVVNQTARRLATGASGLDLAAELRLDCYRVYCDEAYHSLFCADLMQQIRHFEEFTFDSGGNHPALDYFHRQIEDCLPEERPWFELFFVIVSETLISGVLSGVPHHAAVIPAVRMLVADHAEDEAGHHRLFSRVCEVAWGQASAALRVKISSLLPDFIVNFLSPDTPAIRAILSGHFTQPATEDIIRESYPEEQSRQAVASASRSTVRLFERIGMMERAETREAFERRGLFLRAVGGRT